MSEEYNPWLVEASCIFVTEEVTYFRTMPFPYATCPLVQHRNKCPEIPKSVYLGVTEFQAWDSVQSLHEGISSWIEQQTGTGLIFGYLPPGRHPLNFPREWRPGVGWPR